MPKPPLPPETRDLDALRRVMADLRTPETGCPWDLEQDFASIAPYTVEEAYEVADAIERGDMDDLKGELGDLLLQVVYHSQMAEEAGAFALDDVVSAIVEKMIRRHPHVYGTEAHGGRARLAKGFWERGKAEERAARAVTRGEGAGRPSVLDDVPRALPALVRAVKLQKRAARVGFDWPDVRPVLAKVREEIGELEEAIEVGDGRARIGDELGDILFVLANLGRHFDIDPEAALAGTNARFVRRFHHIERRLREDGKSPEDVTLAEMDRYWDEAKAIERAET